MNLFYVLLLVLLPAFNSSEAWWYRYYSITESPYTSEPPLTESPFMTTQHPWPASSSQPCGYWYNKPCYWAWATSQPSDTSTTHYQRERSQPETRWYTPPYYWTTSESSSMSPFMTTQHPWPGSSSKPCGYWYNKPCYWATTQPSHTTTTHYQRQTQPSHTTKTHYQRQTRSPYRRRLYVQTSSKPADAPELNITVYGQMQDREHVIVMCSFGRRFTKSSFQLSVEGEHNYTMKDPLCYSNEKCVFDVKVSPPVSFTCVHEINSAVNRRSETYTYSPSDCPAILAHHEEGVYSFYIGFFSFIVVGLVIMTAAVIIATFKSNAKGPKITGAADDYINV